MRTPLHWRFFLCAMVMLCCAVSQGDTLEGKVEAVVDGDTMLIHDGKTTHKFRFLGADAPEQWQRRFRESRRHLNDYILGKKVVVEWMRLQICPRGGGKCSQLAKILYRGEDVGLRQITRGYAWHDRRQAGEQSATDKALYGDAQVNAKQKRRGLWKDSGPIPPWESKPRKR